MLKREETGHRRILPREMHRPAQDILGMGRRLGMVLIAFLGVPVGDREVERGRITGNKCPSGLVNRNPISSIRVITTEIGRIQQIFSVCTYFRNKYIRTSILGYVKRMVYREIRGFRYTLSGMPDRGCQLQYHRRHH